MRRIVLAVAAIAALALNSCQKEEASTVSSGVQVVADDQLVATMYADVRSEVDQVTSSLKAGVLPDSTGSRTVTTVKNPDNSYTKTVVYNGWSVGPAKLWVKNGKLIINISDNFTNINVTFDNFTLNGNKIEGNKNIVINPTAKTRTVTLTNGKITFTDGTIYQHQFTQVWTQVKGGDTPLFIWDDEYTVELASAGLNRRGESFTESTVTPLYYKVAWPMFVSGVVKRNVASHTILTDYGTGTADFWVTITIDGKAYPVNLVDLTAK